MFRSDPLRCRPCPSRSPPVAPQAHARDSQSLRPPPSATRPPSSLPSVSRWRQERRQSSPGRLMRCTGRCGVCSPSFPSPSVAQRPQLSCRSPLFAPQTTLSLKDTSKISFPPFPPLVLALHSSWRLIPMALLWCRAKSRVNRRGSKQSCCCCF